MMRLSRLFQIGKADAPIHRAADEMAGIVEAIRYEAESQADGASRSFRSVDIAATSAFIREAESGSDRLTSLALYVVSVFPDTRNNRRDSSDALVDFYATLLQNILHRIPRLESAPLAAVLSCLELLPLPSECIEEVIGLSTRSRAALGAEHVHLLRKERERLIPSPWARSRRLQFEIESLTGLEGELPLSQRDSWSRKATEAILSTTSAQSREAWARLLKHCELSDTSKPSKKWINQASDLVQSVGQDAFKLMFAEWVPLVDRANNDADNPLRLTRESEDQLRGLAWVAGIMADSRLLKSLADLAISCHRSVPGIGPRSVKVANAAIWALTNFDGIEAVGKLAYLKVRLKRQVAQKAIDKALATIAKREGLSREEIEELEIPEHGFSEVGVRTDLFGDIIGEIRIDNLGKPKLAWIRSDGIVQKSAPAEVGSTFSEEVADLKLAVAESQKTIAAQRARLEKLFLRKKTWRYPQWRGRYLDHPIVGTLTRRLLWVIEGETVVWTDGNFVTINRTVFDPSPTDEVRLWHPISIDPSIVLQWRAFLAELGITQPFKQAHREIYQVAPAERETNYYSNRFAAHLLRQHVLAALCRGRDWSYTLQTIGDSEVPPAILAVPDWGLRAEFWCTADALNARQDRSDINEASVFNYVTSNQVRVYAADRQPESRIHYGVLSTDETENPIRMSEIPDLVFSEIMRDVDLFVGVGSVGNDPRWLDTGRSHDHSRYWTSFATGELGEMARIRKDVLTELLPKLSIAPVASVEGRFLHVTGKLGQYAIHIGSANVLQRPGNRFICIVPSRNQPDWPEVFLPFDGDRTLSIILSKAFMLANDDEITDYSIVRQIRSKRPDRSSRD